jgi:hypothetical protein
MIGTCHKELGASLKGFLLVTIWTSKMDYDPLLRIHESVIM